MPVLNGGMRVFCRGLRSCEDFTICRSTATLTAELTVSATIPGWARDFFTVPIVTHKLRPAIDLDAKPPVVLN